MESSGHETGAWRGQVHDGEATMCDVGRRPHMSSEGYGDTGDRKQ